MLETTLIQKPSLALPTATSSLLLVALFATTAGAQDLIKKGSGFHVNTATDQASHADVTVGSSGGIAVAFQGNLNDTWFSGITENADGTATVAPNQLVRSGNFTRPSVFAVPPASSDPLGRGYAVVEIQDLEIEMQFPDLPVTPPHVLGTTDHRVSVNLGLSDPVNDFFGLMRRFEGTVFYTLFGLTPGSRDPVPTTYSLFYTEGAFVEHVLATFVQLISQFPGNAEAVGIAPRTTPTAPTLLIAELAHTAAGGSTIQGRFFDDAANPIGGEFPISPPAFAGFKPSFDLAATPSGTAMVVWTESTFGLRRPMLVLVGPQGPASPALFVSSTATVDQWHPQVAAVGELFVVAWERRGVNGDPDTIHARYIDASIPSAPVFGPEIELSGPDATGGRLDVAIAADDLGRIVVAWTERSPDLAFSDVVVQRLLLELPIFDDGFESGDTSAWSAKLP